jgi:protein-L-isoaspartate(D-aspartate) O-methyltransferase
MVDRQLRRRGISDERVLEAMAEVPRERFVPEAISARAYNDSALPIGHEQTISQPWVVAAICQALALEGDEKVLEVGTGSGYSAAVLSHLASHTTTEAPHSLLEQLAQGGRLVVPIATGSADLLTSFRRENGELHQETIGPCRFVPLIGAEGFDLPR